MGHSFSGCCQGVITSGLTHWLSIWPFQPVTYLADGDEDNNALCCGTDSRFGTECKFGAEFWATYSHVRLLVTMRRIIALNILG